MKSDFAGTTAQYYAEYRRDLPVEQARSLVDHVGLRADDIAVDLGCGTGQLAVPLATHCAAVIAIDPEPDMLAGLRARHARASVVCSGRRPGPDQALRNCRTDQSAVDERRAMAATLGLDTQVLSWQAAYPVTIDWVLGHLGSALSSDQMEKSGELRTLLQPLDHDEMVEEVITTVLVARRHS